MKPTAIIEMPRTSRQDRYNNLLIEENAYNTLNPHPQAQTLYTYPFSTLVVTATLLLCLTPGFVCLALGYTKAAPALALSLVAPGLACFILASPHVGLTKRRMVETPTALETVLVHRPFFGRRKCEIMYGVTGGNPTIEHRELWWRKQVRHEPALWVVEW